MAHGPAPDLQHASRLIKQLQESLASASRAHFTYLAPIIDRQTSGWFSDPARGINKLEENVFSLKARIEAVRILYYKTKLKADSQR
jgi:hypothetical protein